MVIVILGILAAVALPKFTDLSADAKVAATNGVAGALASAGNTNYAVRSLHSGSGVPTTGLLCTNLGALLEGGYPSGYTITGTVPSCSVSDGTTTIPVNVPAI
jgi:MSHA pilin protein MshA